MSSHSYIPSFYEFGQDSSDLVQQQNYKATGNGIPGLDNVYFIKDIL